jgi:uncharacterized RDD family membrane protein YckC
MNYAGFWKRFGAAIIDIIILGIVNFVALTPILGMMGLAMPGSIWSTMMSGGTPDPEAIMAAAASMFGVGWVVTTAVDILYHSFLESSKFQGSVGKMALGIIVTDTAGAKLDFGKAAIRNAGKIISGMILFIGYIMAGFTEKKQALHDMIASTLVVNK